MAARLGAFRGVPARCFILLQAEHDIAEIASMAVPGPGIVRLEIDPELMITRGGVISLSQLAAEPNEAAGPRTVRYDDGAVALVGSAS